MSARPPRTQCASPAHIGAALLAGRTVWVLDCAGKPDPDGFYLGTEDEVMADLLEWCGTTEWPSGWTLFRVEVRP